MGFFDDRDDVGPPPDPFRLDDTGGRRDVRFPIPLRWVGIAAGLLVALFTLSVFKSLWVDHLWFESVGLSSVYRTTLVARTVLFVLGAVVSGLVIGANLWLARRYAPRGPEQSFIEDIDPEAIRRVVWIALGAGTIFLAVVFGATAAGAWDTLLTWWNAVPFGQEDPAFSRDISFYLFDLPAYHFIQQWVLGLGIVALAATAAVYGLTFSLQAFTITITREVRIHVSVLVGLLLLTIAWGTWIGIFDLATARGGIVAGATYTDLHARLPVRWMLVALGSFAGLATIASSFLSSSLRVPAFAIGIWAIVAVAGGLFYPGFVQSFQVDPNELEKEEQYIRRNIDLTRLAWGLDRIEVVDFPAEPAVTEAELAAHPGTIENIRLLDPRPLQDTFKQLQSIRPLYDFNDVDVDRYVIDGELRQVMISGRELDLARARAAEGSGWVRQRLQLTHGYGAVVAPVNEVTPQGQPALITQDIPPKSDLLPISEEGARIYFGELTDHYVVVGSNEVEFDYPVGDSFAETTYAPDRGIRLGNMFQRIALAWELGDTNLLISGQLTTDSRVLLHRALDQRIPKVAPFLTLDSDPYLVIVDERLVWIQDAYTTADSFPYSQPLGEVNYIRNSVKIVVDALTGDMTFYLIDPTDPVAQTWAKIFPDLFTDAAEMPQEIRAHLRYPQALFEAQAQQYLAYHITDPRVFFVGEDIWAVPTERLLRQEQPVEPYYVLMPLPGEADRTEEFVLVLPFTPRSKQNTIAWMAARSDGEHYGELRAYRFPTDDLVFGPAQIEARIDQTPGISQQLTLWNQSGSEVFRGNLLMVPIGDSFLFVEPIYLQAESSRLPELKRVVVANGDKIAMEETFQRSLDVIFGRRASSLPGEGGNTPTPTPTPSPTPEPAPAPEPGGTVRPPLPENLADLLRDARRAATDAQAELDRLAEILEALGALDDATPGATPGDGSGDAGDGADAGDGT